MGIAVVQSNMIPSDRALESLRFNGFDCAEIFFDRHGFDVQEGQLTLVLANGGDVDLLKFTPEGELRLSRAARDYLAMKRDGQWSEVSRDDHLDLAPIQTRIPYQKSQLRWISLEQMCRVLIDDWKIPKELLQVVATHESGSTKQVLVFVSKPVITISAEDRENENFRLNRIGVGIFQRLWERKANTDPSQTEPLTQASMPQV